MVFLSHRKPRHSRTVGERGFVFCAQGKRNSLIL